jgi:GxxExxY protein
LESDLTEEIIGGFYAVYGDLGFGFLESTYLKALVVEFQARNLPFAREVPVEVTYRGTVVGRCRYDLVVDNRVLVEVKSTRAIVDADRRQIQNYLKASAIQVGLLLHFGPTAKVHRFLFTNERKRLS